MYQTAWLTDSTEAALDQMFTAYCEDEEDLYALESIFDAFLDQSADYSMSFLDSAYEDMAMEGTNMDAINIIRKGLHEMKAWKKEMKKQARQKNFKQAATLAKSIASKYDNMKQAINQLPQSTSSAALIGIGTTLFTLAFGALVSKGVNKAFKEIKPLKQAHDKVTRKIYDTRMKDLEKTRTVKFGKNKDKTYTKLGRMADKNMARQAKDIAKANTTKLSRITNRKGYKEALKNAKDQVAGGKEWALLNPNTGKVIKDAAGNVVKSGVYAGNGEKLAKATIRAGVYSRAHNITKGVVDLAVGDFASSMLGKFMKKKGWESAGDADNEPMGPNDFNSLLNALRKVCDDGKKKFLKNAQEYEQKAGGDKATEAWLLN